MIARLNWLAFVLLATWTTVAVGRTWTDATGLYSFEADLIAFNDETVIFQRPDHELGAMSIERLSEMDRAYLQSKEAQEAAERNVGSMQTWTLRNGLKIVGRVVDFARKDMTLSRRRSKVYVNDRLIENLPEIYQKMVPHIVNQFEPIDPVSKVGVESWLTKQKGATRTFTLEGVYLELENGDQYGVPFFFFSDEDLSVLRPGWVNWLKSHEQDHEDSYASREKQAFMLQAAAAARARDRQVQRQIAQMQLQLQAVEVGLTSLWEVTLYPARPGIGPPLWVVMPGRNSAQATAAALAANPGYSAGPVRRVSQ
jgi:hypothetical protein